MRHKKLKLSALFLLGLGITGLQAQTSINATGGNASGSGGSVSYSVGQVVYTNNTGTNGSVAQGVQQPYEISVVTAIEEAKGINLSVTAYPNPTTDYLTLSISAFDISNVSYQLYDMNGKLLQSENEIVRRRANEYFQRKELIGLGHIESVQAANFLESDGVVELIGGEEALQTVIELLRSNSHLRKNDVKLLEE